MPLSLSEKQIILAECKKMAQDIFKMVGDDFFSITNLSLRMAIDTVQVKKMLHDLKKSYYLREVKRNDVTVFKIVLNDSERIKLMQDSISFKTKVFRMEVAYVNELIKITQNSNHAGQIKKV